MMGIVTTDCWKAYRHHLHKCHKHKQIDIELFANLLAKDMLDNDFSTATSVDEMLYIPNPDANDKSIESNESFQTEELIKKPAAKIV